MTKVECPEEENHTTEKSPTKSHLPEVKLSPKGYAWTGEKSPKTKPPKKETTNK